MNCCLSHFMCQGLFKEMEFTFHSHFFINFKKLSAYLAQNFLNLFKLPHLFDFDPILSDLWPVECKRSCFETPSKMQNL